MNFPLQTLVSLLFKPPFPSNPISRQLFIENVFSYLFHRFFLISNYTSYTDCIIDCKSFATASVVFWFGIDNSKLFKILPFVMI